MYSKSGVVDTSSYPRTYQRTSMLKSSPTGPSICGDLFLDRVTGKIWIFTDTYGWEPYQASKSNHTIREMI